MQALRLPPLSSHMLWKKFNKLTFYRALNCVKAETTLSWFKSFLPCHVILRKIRTEKALSAYGGIFLPHSHKDNSSETCFAGGFRHHLLVEVQRGRKSIKSNLELENSTPFQNPMLFRKFLWNVLHQLHLLKPISVAPKFHPFVCHFSFTKLLTHCWAHTWEKKIQFTDWVIFKID